MASAENVHAAFDDAVEPIAIVGMACRFPGDVASPSEFWDMLVRQRSGHGKVPADRFDANVWTHPDHDRKGAIQARSGFFLQHDISLFDAPFFSITAKEAMGMDPMQRQILEVAYECFENAGVPFENLAGSMTSVYTGVMTNDYERISQSEIFSLPQNAASGTSRAMLSNRLSWFFNLSGPSLTLDTACSSSLYAMHLACQSIRLRESQQALVAGVNLILHPNFISQLSSMHMLSPDGISHSFDERANGYARGEAIGAILVKPLSKALADGDTIRAVIRGSGANQDGKTPGITMPSREAQAKLINTTYATAGLTTTDTTYFEAHGTGTKIGDPIELSAIGASFAPDRTHDRPLYVGSVKTNVGHTEGMAGLAGVIKTVLSMEHAVLPGLVAFETFNSKLLLDDWKLELPLESMPWPSDGLRRASVNSFGFGGANAHVILDDAYHYLKTRGLEGRHCTRDLPPLPAAVLSSRVDSREQTVSKDFKLLLFSAQDQNGLDRLSKRLGQYLLKEPSQGQRPDIDLDDLAFTLAYRRSQLGIRSFAVCRTVRELATDSLRTISSLKQKRHGQPENIIFIFTGQGAQWPLMGRELLQYSAFHDSVSKSQSYLDELGCTWSAADLLHEPGPRINLAEHCQPICTILQVALVDLLASWGVTPRATVGHSSGEIGAAYAAGGVSHKDAVKIAYMRGYYCGQIQSRLKEKQGAMLAAGLTVQEARRYLQEVDEDSVVIGCMNSPSSVTLSGDVHAISYLEQRIKLDGKFARKLRVEVAYHSPHMQAVAQDFLDSLDSIEPTKDLRVPMFSSVTTKQLDSPVRLNAQYWVTNMVSAVRFSEAVDSLLALSEPGFKGRKSKPVNWFAAVEIGPHEALKGPFQQCALAAGSKKASSLIPYTSMIRRGEPGTKSAAEAAGLLWSLGHPIDVLNVNNVDTARRKSLTSLSNLPPYAWQHSKGFWHESSSSRATRLITRPRTDLLGIPADNQNPHEPRWKNFLRLSENPWMRDHAITGTILYPAAGMLVMALEAALQIAQDQKRVVRAIEFHDVHFERGLVVPDSDEAVETNISLRPHESLDLWFHWTIDSQGSDLSWKRHAHGLISLVLETETGPSDGVSMWKAETAKFSSIKAAANALIDPTAFYAQLAHVGMGYGPAFTNLTMAAAVAGEQTGHGTIAIPDTKSTMPQTYEFPHLIHPATLDAIFHLIFVALFEGKPMTESAVPVSIEKMFIAVFEPLCSGEQFSGYATGRKIDARDSSGDLVVSDSNWSGPKITLSNLIVRKVSSSAVANNRNDRQQATRPPERVSELLWMEDIDLLELPAANTLVETNSHRYRSLASTSSTAKAAAWLEWACFKRADLKVTAVADTILSADKVVEVLSAFAPVTGSERRLANVSIITTSQEVQKHLKGHSKLKDTSVKVIRVEPGSAEFRESSDLVIFGYDSACLVLNDRLGEWASCLTEGAKLMVLSDSAQDTAVEAGLKAHGFNETLLKLSDSSGCVLVVGASPNTPPRETEVVYMLAPMARSEKLTHFIQHLSATFASEGITLLSKSLNDIEHLTGQKVISLLEVEDPFVINWSEAQFDQFRRLVFSQPYILWLTRGGILAKGEQSLQFAPTTGLLRTIRTEIPQVAMPHLDLSPSVDLENACTAELVRKVFNSTAKAAAMGREDLETEFAEQNGSLFIPRIFGNNAMDGEVNSHAESPTPVLTLVSEQQARPLRLIKKPSMAPGGQIQWEDDPDAILPIADDEVEIQTKYVAVSSADLSRPETVVQQNGGAYAASGVIVRTGADVVDLLSGDEVVFLAPDRKTLKTILRPRKSLVEKLPEDVMLQGAPHLLSSAMVAYHSLRNIANVSPNESVLINLENQDTRFALLQLARERSCKAFIAVTSPLEKNDLMSRCQVSGSRIFYSSNRDLLPSLMAATMGRGFDVVISDQIGRSRREMSCCIAEAGRFVDLSPTLELNDISPDAFRKNASFSWVDIWRLRSAQLESLFEGATFLLRSSIQVHSRAPVFANDDLEGAWSLLQERPGSSVTIHFDDKARLPVSPRPAPPPRLDSKATYVIAGGLGALGLTIGENMVSHGAQHLVLLSRSGVTSSRQEHAVLRLRQRGCQVDTVICDVTDREQVMKVAHLAQQSSWSIKGLIQCAMVLNDSIFENMTFEKWKVATQPKIKGTWNLHDCLPKDLDFFIVLSSMSGIIGNAGQANYAAGNTYEDALAHYRRGQSLAATTLNVGLVTDASHFDADATIEDYLNRYGHWTSAIVTDREMQIVIEAVMREATKAESPNASQVPIIPLSTQMLVGLNGSIPRGPGSRNPWSKERKFNHRIESGSQSEMIAGSSTQTLASQLQKASSGAEAVALVEASLRTHVAAAMTASADDIDSDKPLYALGVDSLKAIEVRNWVFKELKCDVSVFDVLSPIPLAQLAARLAKKSTLVPPELVASIEE
ncbi:hypothetical protein A1O1_04527 [Capronia coronata CBS 617.96]|uniref:Uncharacterized protein n=1 Tax=Capronia coronata CBS 617.96 TaxID=1182541 RepID=W9YP40_9EURO|nr:uncharacterized protein A1O1_04527 [Capronia coronata CBS 617.96]EXJ91415.1 hypothetical protein A1O1_04527 [Capronia coronata CBS 617.96]